MAQHSKVSCPIPSKHVSVFPGTYFDSFTPSCCRIRTFVNKERRAFQSCILVILSQTQFRLPRDMLTGIRSLPQLLPPPPDNIQSPTADAWHSSLMHNRGLFHAFLYGAVIHDRASRGLLNDKVSPELFYTHTEAVRGLTKDLSDPAIFCTDEVILAVLCLAVNGVKQYTTEPARVPSQGPLRSLRMLDIYGILDVVPIHAEGLARLVAVRGGLQNIKMLGLAEAIS